MSRIWARTTQAAATMLWCQGDAQWGAHTYGLLELPVCIASQTDKRVSRASRKVFELGTQERGERDTGMQKCWPLRQQQSRIRQINSQLFLLLVLVLVLRPRGPLRQTRSVACLSLSLSARPSVRPPAWLKQIKLNMCHWT